MHIFKSEENIIKGYFMKRIIALSFAFVISCPLLARAEDVQAKNETQESRARMAEVKDRADFTKLVDQSAEVYGAIAKGPQGEVPSSILKNARCIAVLPNVVTGALVVGGTHGSGLATCRDSNNGWSQPAAISLSQGSIGVQAGAKSTDLVLFFQNDNAVKALKRGNITLGTDASAVAGNFDKAVDFSNAGVVVFSRTEGLFAGASVNGSRIGKNQDDSASYYGKNVDFTALLEGRQSPDSSGYTQKLTKLLP